MIHDKKAEKDSGNLKGPFVRIVQSGDQLIRKLPDLLRRPMPVTEVFTEQSFDMAFSFVLEFRLGHFRRGVICLVFVCARHKQVAERILICDKAV